MIGRGAQGNPWIFREIRHYFDNGEELPPPSSREVLTVMINHLRHLHQVYGEPLGVRVARKHINWYLTGFHGTSDVDASGGNERSESFRKGLMRAQSSQEQFDLLHAFFNEHAPSEGCSPRSLKNSDLDPICRPPIDYIQNRSLFTDY